MVFGETCSPTLILDLDALLSRATLWDDARTQLFLIVLSQVLVWLNCFFGKCHVRRILSQQTEGSHRKCQTLRLTLSTPTQTEEKEEGEMHSGWNPRHAWSRFAWEGIPLLTVFWWHTNTRMYVSLLPGSSRTSKLTSKLPFELCLLCLLAWCAASNFEKTTTYYCRQCIVLVVLASS